jgi:prepilin-type N-terminal cleavage/methylation domain-containing protein
MCGKTAQQYRRAFSLTELMVAIAVSGVILTALMSFTVYAAKSFAAMENYVDLEQKSQYAIDTMTRNIRETKSLVSFGTRDLNGATVTNVLTFLDSDNQLLTYNFTNSVLIQSKGGVDAVLLNNVDYLCFQIFQRNTLANTYDQFPTSSVGLCKLVSVSWICSRNVMGNRMNTECVQTAKIVIRKQ